MFLPADRFLVCARARAPSGGEGVPGHPRGRCIDAPGAGALLAVQRQPLPGENPRRGESCAHGRGPVRRPRSERGRAGGAASAGGDGRQERAMAAARLVAGRDGRADAGLGVDPRGDDGFGRRVSAASGRPAALGGRVAGDGRCRLHRRVHRASGRRDRPDAERYQTGAGLFDDLATGLHGRRRRARRLRRRGLPPGDACLLQGAALPRRGFGHPRRGTRRDARRRARRSAGYARDGRAGRAHAADLHRVPRRRAFAGRLPAPHRRVSGPRTGSSPRRPAHRRRCFLRWPWPPC